MLWEGYDWFAGWHNEDPEPVIGYSANAVAPDYQLAQGAPGFDYSNWMYYSSAATVHNYGDPVAMEWWANANIGGYDPYQSLYWPFLTGANWHSSFLLPNSTYNPYRTTFAWDVIDYWLGGYEDRGWIIFRDAEYRNYIINDGYRNISPEGGRGPYENHLAVLTPTAYDQYCSAAVIAEEADKAPGAGATPVWRPCGLDGSPHYLPTPKATLQATTPTPEPTQDFNMMQRLFNRQALAVSAGGTMGIKADEAWQYYGETHDISVTLSYLDIGTGNVTISLATGPSTQDDHVIALGNTGLWQRARWDVASAAIGNTINVSGRGNSFIKVANGAGSLLYLHELYADVTSGTRGMMAPYALPPEAPATSRLWLLVVVGIGAIGAGVLITRRRRSSRA